MQIFCVQKFNFRGWSWPQKLNMDPTLNVILHMSTVGTDTMDMHRILVRERGQAYFTLNNPPKVLSELAFEHRLDI